MGKRLVWIDVKNFRGYGCSDCNWRFPVSSDSDPESLLMSCVRSVFGTHECDENPFSVEANHGMGDRGEAPRQR